MISMPRKVRHAVVNRLKPWCVRRLHSSDEGGRQPSMHQGRVCEFWKAGQQHRRPRHRCKICGVTVSLNTGTPYRVLRCG